jgi:biopolymer transport protein ExbB/TolQ
MATWIIATQWAARLVLILLLGLSVWSVSIMIERRRVFRGAGEPGDGDEARKLIGARDWKALEQWIARHSQLPAGVMRAALEVKASAQVDHAVRAYLTSERAKLEKGLTVLATLGSNAPFIGLFGTVLGIIHAFAALADQKGGVSSVMTGISEALVATAVGLFVAIPAVVAYNYFARRLRDLFTECEALKDYYLSRLEG